MRIDAASGSGAWQVGFFSGSFRGELEGLSGSLEELSSFIEETSSSLDETIRTVSESLETAVEDIDRNIQSISSSFVETIVQNSSSFSSSLVLVEENASSSLADVSSSFSSNLVDISSSFSSNLSSFSSSLVNVSSSFSSSLVSVSSSFSSSLADSSASFSTDLSNVSESLAAGIDDAYISLSDIIEANSESIASDIQDIQKSFVSNNTFQEYTASVSGMYIKPDDGIPEKDLAQGVKDKLDYRELFVASRPQTTFAEIQAAYNAGKSIVLNHGDYIYQLLCYDSYEGFLFTNIDILGTIMQYACTQEGWSDGEIYDIREKFDMKVDKVTGKGLSTNDYTTAEKTKLGALPTSSSLAQSLAAKYTKPSTGIPSSDMSTAVQTSLGKADTAYQIPSGGIPETDLTTAVSDKLNFKEIFVADYGTTTISELQAAYDAGKYLICNQDETIYTLAQSGEGYVFTFVNVSSAGVVKSVSCTVDGTSTGTWSSQSIALDKVFIANYGETTADQIDIALMMNQLVICTYSGRTYIRTLESSGYIYFTALHYNGTIYYIKLKRSDGTWSNTSVKAETTSNKVTSLSSGSTDTQYPSAKCVYDALGEKQNTITEEHKLDYSLISNTPTIPDTVVANPTIPQGTTPTDLENLKVGNDYFAIPQGGNSSAIIVNSVSASASSNPSEGDKWYNTTDNKVYTYSTEWDSGSVVATGSIVINSVTYVPYVFTGFELVSVDNRVFYADRSTVTHAQLVEAYRAGKYIMLRWVGDLYFLSRASAGYMYPPSDYNLDFSFTRIDINGFIEQIQCNYNGGGSGDWTNTSYSIPQVVADKEDKSNKVRTISSGSTHQQYPTAKCVYDLIGDVETLINAL